MWIRNSLRGIGSILVGVILAGASAASACGPFYPSTIIDKADANVLAAPIADVALELGKLKPKTMPDCKAILPDKDEDQYAQTAMGDIADLESALAALPPQQRNSLLQSYFALRGKLQSYAKAVAEWRNAEEENRLSKNGSSPQPRPLLPPVSIPPGLPEEFSLYVRGAAAWHQGYATEAISCWQKLLALPPEQRRYRSTWAAYMLGKTYMGSDADEARQYFQQTRQLAREGCTDSIGLAAASLGWQARVEFDAKNYEQAIELYLEDVASGDTDAWTSIRDVCTEVLERDSGALVHLAKDPIARRAITAVMLANGDPIAFDRGKPSEPTSVWLQAVEQSGVSAVEDADHLAWSAYQEGRFKAARAWLKKADPDAPMALWISAKLDLREGKIDQALPNLAKAAKAFPQDEQWHGTALVNADDSGDGDDAYVPQKQVNGEIAVIKLSRGQYVEAMDMLLRNGWEEDGNYIAERILTVDELLAYVKRNWPAPKSRPSGTSSADGQESSAGPPVEETTCGRIRKLLARRLTRLGRWKEAREFFPEPLRKSLDAYVAAIRTGADTKKPTAERAGALWKAAQMTHGEEGWELLGTAFEQEWAIHDSEGPELISLRNKNKSTLFPITADELERFRETEVEYGRSFHYRYIAAEHAWNAAALMPDNAEETARILWEAGRWLAPRDPKAADRFYKALVRRCGGTSLGQQADAIHWFPKELATQPAK